MSEVKIGYIGQVTGLFRKPAETFKTIEETHLTKGLLVELLSIVFAVVSTVKYMSKIPLEVLVPQISGVNIDPAMLGNMGMFSAIGVAFSMLIGFVLSTLIIHGISYLLGGKGSLKRFFAIQGFAAAPAALNQLIRVVDAYTVGSGTLVGYFVANRDVQNRLLRALIGTNLLSIFGVASIIFATYGVVANYELSRGKAFAAAIVPWVMYLALNFL